MKRRNFVQNLLLAPVAPAVAAAAGQAPPEKAAAQAKPETEPKTPVRRRPWGPQRVPKLDLTGVDLTGQPAPHYFTAAQFATLQKLGALLVPPLKNNPGALDAQAPEFLDFLVSVSPDERQNLYQFGLDSLDSQSKNRFQKPFCDLDAQQAGRILRPLLVVRPWAEDFPSDPLQKFIAQVHEDLRAATENSREWAAASEKSGRRFTRGFRGSGYYWFPIDPISQG
jgi:hypothetical protein